MAATRGGEAIIGVAEGLSSLGGFCAIGVAREVSFPKEDECLCHKKKPLTTTAVVAIAINKTASDTRHRFSGFLVTIS
jgi:hypothetical protein